MVQSENSWRKLMDAHTIEVYNAAASQFASEWRNQPLPIDMYDLLQRFFHRGGKTADIGCGSGRDVAWLNDNGFPTIGYDAATGLLQQAEKNFPHLEFATTVLPDLDGIENETFDNVLCETVIMHLQSTHIAQAFRRLLDILKPDGILYLSWRISEGESLHDKAGRLYSVFDTAVVTDNLRDSTILHSERTTNQSSGKSVQRMIVTRR
jgi:SAM-dependent methyltransferase